MCSYGGTSSNLSTITVSPSVHHHDFEARIDDKAFSMLRSKDAATTLGIMWCRTCGEVRVIEDHGSYFVRVLGQCSGNH